LIVRLIGHEPPHIVTIRPTGWADRRTTLPPARLPASVGPGDATPANGSTGNRPETVRDRPTRPQHLPRRYSAGATRYLPIRESAHAESPRAGYPPQTDNVAAGGLRVVGDTAGTWGIWRSCCSLLWGWLQQAAELPLKPTPTFRTTSVPEAPDYADRPPRPLRIVSCCQGVAAGLIVGYHVLDSSIRRRCCAGQSYSRAAHRERPALCAAPSDDCVPPRRASIACNSCLTIATA
jgi:hypothetical protein